MGSKNIEHIWLSWSSAQACDETRKKPCQGGKGTRKPLRVCQKDMRETGEWGRDEGCWGVGWRGRNNKAQVDMGRCGACQAHSASLHCWQFRAYIFLHCLVGFSQLIKKELFLSSPPRGGEGCLHTHAWRSEVNTRHLPLFLSILLFLEIMYPTEPGAH